MYTHVYTISLKLRVDSYIIYTKCREALDIMLQQNVKTGINKVLQLLLTQHYSTCDSY